jgi:hypothetical protein
VPFTFPCSSTNSNLKVSQRRPIDRIIYHFVAFGQLLLFMGLNLWTFLFVCFVGAIFQRSTRSDLWSKLLLYPGMGMMLVCIWIIAATGRFGEVRWWPSKDRLSRLVPPSIANATMIKCRRTLLFIDLERPDAWPSSHPATSGCFSLSKLI